VISETTPEYHNGRKSEGIYLYIEDIDLWAKQKVDAYVDSLAGGLR
jgi:hypothetical protein